MADPSQLSARDQWKRLTQVLRQEEYAMPPVKGRNTWTIHYPSALDYYKCSL